MGLKNHSQANMNICLKSFPIMTWSKLNRSLEKVKKMYLPRYINLDQDTGVCIVFVTSTRTTEASQPCIQHMVGSRVLADKKKQAAGWLGEGGAKDLNGAAYGIEPSLKPQSRWAFTPSSIGVECGVPFLPLLNGLYTPFYRLPHCRFRSWDELVGEDSARCLTLTPSIPTTDVECG